MCYKVTLTRVLPDSGDTIGVRHLSHCTRELAGEAARVFALGAPIGSTLTIAKVETVQAPKMARGKPVLDTDGAPIMSDETNETIVAKATRVAEEGPWLTLVGVIKDVTHVFLPASMPVAPRLSAAPLTALDLLQ